MPAHATRSPRSRPTKASLIAGALAIALAQVSPVWTSQKPAAPSCHPVGSLVRVPNLPEGSGVAVSRRDPTRAWAHNDSGQPMLVALDERGTVTGELELTGARVEDWEALAIGPCPQGSCLYVADIGDNDAERKRITIYRVPEPEAAAQTAAVDAIHATYPDGAHDAETLLVTPQGDLFIVTKGDTGAVAVYRFPRDLPRDATVVLERVGKPRDSRKAGSDDRITDGAVSPNGAWVVLRTSRDVRFYQATNLLAGDWREAGRVDLQQLGEPQGEGVAFADDASLYLVGEGGGQAQPGTFGRLTCTRDENPGR